jgi:phosphate starvation-inducible protein PhoH and related proteins
LKEKLIEITHINPVDIFGVNEEKLNILRTYFPKLKLIARGSSLKIMGDDDNIKEFEKKLDLMLAHFHKYNTLTEGNIDNLMLENGEEILKGEQGKDLILFGNGGHPIKAKTKNQRLICDEIEKNDMVFAIGPAGSGKTYTAVAMAVKALKNKEVRRIVLTRPAVEAGEHLGFLPGDLKEKLDPYLQPLYDALRDMIPAEKLAAMLEGGIIQIAPLAFMRGRTLDNAFVILDEAQNATEGQIKMFLTRMGMNAKFVITGDVTQVDLPKHQKSGLIKSLNILKGIDGIAMVYLDENDVLRHRLVKRITKAFDKDEN